MATCYVLRVVKTRKKFRFILATLVNICAIRSTYFAKVVADKQATMTFLWLRARTGAIVTTTEYKILFPRSFRSAPDSQWLLLLHLWFTSYFGSPILHSVHVGNSTSLAANPGLPLWLGFPTIIGHHEYSPVDLHAGLTLIL